MSETAFVDVEVEPCEASPDGVSLRFKVVRGEPSRLVRRLRYESEDGTAGLWRVSALDATAQPAGSARAYRVEDSSEGTACLVVGGAQGLLLEHEPSGACERVPYLVLADGTEMEG